MRISAALLLAFCVAPPAAAVETYVATILPGETRVLAAAFSPDGKLIVTGGDDGSVRLWDAADGSSILVATGHEDTARSVAFSPDGSLIVSASWDGTTRVWDAASGAERLVLNQTPGVATALFSPDGTRIAVAGEDGIARVFDATDGSLVATLAGQEAPLLDIAFSPDGSRIATAGFDETARIFDAASGREITVLPHEATVYGVAFSPDGAQLATAGYDEMVRLFDTATGSETGRLAGHAGTVADVDFSPDGRRLVTASSDGEARIWDLATGETLAVLGGHLADVLTADFSPDGNRIVTASEDGSARIWAKAASVALPAGPVGVWYHDFSAPEPMPAEVTTFACLTMPIVVRGDGIVVVFQGDEGQVPEIVGHMRCAADLACALFAGPPAQGLVPQGEGRFTLEGDGASMCVDGECRALARCPAPAWSDEQRGTGFAMAWEAAVLEGTR